MDKAVAPDAEVPPNMSPPPTTLHDWFAVGQGMTVDVAGVTVAFRVIGHKGRRTRIVVTAPAGAVIRAD